eukprot:maker-scaffold779_size98098-snap-gene-0.19 protein:Tk05334 transcript:maker-scaffold779_size98098-snap-gene-0.19-mRNA-1 annotation:"-alpha-glucan branching enzyme"
MGQIFELDKLFLGFDLDKNLDDSRLEGSNIPLQGNSSFGDCCHQPCLGLFLQWCPRPNQSRSRGRLTLPSRDMFQGCAHDLLVFFLSPLFGPTSNPQTSDQRGFALLIFCLALTGINSRRNQGGAKKRSFLTFFPITSPASPETCAEDYQNRNLTNLELLPKQKPSQEFLKEIGGGNSFQLCFAKPRMRREEEIIRWRVRTFEVKQILKAVQVRRASNV